MSTRQRSFPYPVLTPYSDDVVSCAFEVTLISEITSTQYVLKASAHTSCRDLEEMVQRREACYAAQVECPATMYRHLHKSFDSEFRIDIPAHEVDGRVIISPMIIAVADNACYLNRSFHQDYAGASFVIRKGDVLAIDDVTDFDALKKEDVLRRIPSIFSVRRGDTPGQPLDVDIGDHKITIWLSPENFDLYTELSQDAQWKPVIASFVVVPALVHVLHQLKPGDEDRRWYMVLARKLRELGIDIRDQDELQDSALRLAWQLVGDPITEAFRTMKAIGETDSD